MADLGENERSLAVDFVNPRHATPAQMADAASKTVADVPEFAGTRRYWKMKGYRDDEVDEIMSELDEAKAKAAVDLMLARRDGQV